MNTIKALYEKLTAVTTERKELFDQYTAKDDECAKLERDLLSILPREQPVVINLEHGVVAILRADTTGNFARLETQLGMIKE